MGSIHGWPEDLISVTRAGLRPPAPVHSRRGAAPRYCLYNFVTLSLQLALTLPMQDLYKLARSPRGHLPAEASIPDARIADYWNFYMLPSRDQRHLHTAAFEFFSIAARGDATRINTFQEAVCSPFRKLPIC